MNLLHVFFAATPVILLIVLLGVLKVSGDKSALITLAATILIAIFSFGFSTVDTGFAFVYGALKAVFPILIIILMAIFSYNVLLHTNKMEVLKQQFAAISTDKSIQVLLLTWGFGGLLEGMAGFGTAVAIPAAILISLGFKPIFSAVVSLVANSVPTAFGAVGIPVIALFKESGVNSILELGSNLVIQLSPLMFVVPFMLVFMTDPSIKALPKNILISMLVGGVSLVVQYLAVHYIGAETPAILGSLASILVIVLFGKLTGKKRDRNDAAERATYSTAEVVNAWTVYGLILLLVMLTGPLFMPIRTFLQSLAQTAFEIPVNGVVKVHRVTWLTDAGGLLFIGSIVGGLLQGAKLADLLRLLGKTLVQLKKTIVTVVCLIGLSTIMDLSGMINELGLALAVVTGALYPLFAPTIGCLGTFLTGSDTSSNILFGKLQVTVAGEINADTSWLAASNTAGATGGKMISPQSIAVATSACGLQGREGEIMKKAMPFALVYILICGLMVYFF